MLFCKKLFGWRQCDFADYQQAYQLFGGSVLADPRILEFLHSRLKPACRFWATTDSKGDLAGAVCVWDNHHLAGDKRHLTQQLAFHYPLNTDELSLPLAPHWRGVLPWQTRFLSSLHYQQVRNANYLFNARRQLCLAHTLKRKTRLARKNELARFLQAGGSVHPISEFSQPSLIDIYTELMHQRRGVLLNRAPIQDLLSAVADLLFGHVLKYRGEPCAMQWIVKSEDARHLWMDYVNNAMTLSLPRLYIGSVLSWLNTTAAFEYAQQQQKTLRFSFGQPTASYKDLWCSRQPLCRTLA